MPIEHQPEDDVAWLLNRAWIPALALAVLGALYMLFLPPAWQDWFSHAPDKGNATPWGVIVEHARVVWLPGFLQTDGARNLVAAVFSLSIVALTIDVARRARLSRATFLLWLALLAAGAAYQAVTPSTVRHHDVINHRRYVVFVAERHALPRWDDCFMCYHPPLYYVLGGAMFRLFEAAPGHAAWGGLRLVALILYAFYLLAAARICELVLETREGRATALLLLGALPSTPFNGVALGNDGAAYVFWAWSLYWLIRWERETTARSAAMAGLFVAIGFLTKGTAFVPLGVLAATALWQAISAPNERERRFAQGVAGLLVAGIGVYAYVGWSRDFLHYGPTGNLNRLNRYWFAPRDTRFLWHLNGRVYFRSFAFETLDAALRLPNMFLKSFMTGTDTFPAAERRLMTVMAGAFPVMMLVVVVGLAVTTPRDRFPAALFFTLVIGPLFSVAYRHRDGAYSSSDFRYVQPVALALMVTCGVLVERLVTYRRRGGTVAAWASMGAFALAGAAFQLMIFVRWLKEL